MESRPLGKASELAEALGFRITHAWDDLAFGEHSAFIFRLGEEFQPLELYFNRDLELPKRRELEAKFVAGAREAAVPLKLAGSFTVAQKEGAEELELAFYVPAS